MNLNFIKSKKLLLLIDSLFILFAVLLPLVISAVLKHSSTPCAFIAAFGVLCPSCGGTRCANSFFSGRFIEAFGYNPYIFCSIIYLIVGVLFLNIKILFRSGFAEKVFSILSDYRAAIIWVTGFMVFGVLRNVI